MLPWKMSLWQLCIVKEGPGKLLKVLSNLDHCSWIQPGESELSHQVRHTQKQTRNVRTCNNHFLERKFCWEKPWFDNSLLTIRRLNQLIIFLNEIGREFPYFPKFLSEIQKLFQNFKLFPTLLGEHMFCWSTNGTPHISLRSERLLWPWNMTYITVGCYV